jgi:hypothetical protein
VRFERYAVEAVDRIDDETILCRVCWNDNDAKTILRLIVAVEASIDEYSAPIKHGKDFLLLDAPAKPAEHIQRRAIAVAQNEAARFAAIRNL